MRKANLMLIGKIMGGNESTGRGIFYNADGTKEKRIKKNIGDKAFWEYY